MARKFTEVANGIAETAVTKRVTTNEGQTISWYPDGTKQGHVTLSIDLDYLLAILGDRALHSKAGKAQLASGAIVAKVTPGSITRHPNRNI